MAQDGESTGGGRPLVRAALVLAGCSCPISMRWVERSELDSRSTHCSYVGRGLVEGWVLLEFPDKMVQSAWMGAKMADTIILGGVDMVEEGALGVGVSL